MGNALRRNLRSLRGYAYLLLQLYEYQLLVLQLYKYQLLVEYV